MGNDGRLFRGRYIVENNLQDLVLSLHKEGKSAREIQAVLRERGFNISDQTIRNFLRIYKNVKDATFKEAAKSVLKEVEVDIDIKTFSGLLESLKLTKEMINKIYSDENLPLPQKAVILDRLNRTRGELSKTILNMYKELGFKELIDEVFDLLSSSLVNYFKSIGVNDEIVSKVAEIFSYNYARIVNKYGLKK